MIPFHLIYSWLFKSFSIKSEATLIDRLVKEGHQKVIIVKKSWIFALFALIHPLIVLMLSGFSIWIALYSIDIIPIQQAIVWGNILMGCILVISSIAYVIHFRSLHREVLVSDNPLALKEEMRRGDKYFINFFNWSITNQVILVGIIITEIFLAIVYNDQLGDHFLILLLDTIIIIAELFFLSRFRHKMIDLEMDYSVVVAGKVFFINQSGILSDTQTLDTDKIKTIKANFPGIIGSFFNYGHISVLAEGDVIGTMNMMYVPDPNHAVTLIQTLLREEKGKDQISTIPSPPPPLPSSTPLSPLVATKETQNPPGTIEVKPSPVTIHTASTTIKVNSVIR